MRRSLGRLREAQARLLGRRFYCAALAGESAYNICINCDLTVSCNCQDFDGSGQLGSLEESTLEEIFAGPTADRFRRELAAGRLPLDTCARCADLQMIDSTRADVRRTSYRLPHRGIMIENNVHCNLNCLSCARFTVARHRRRRVMSLGDIERVATLMADLGMERISYYNLGEPFLAPRILDELTILRRHCPQSEITSSTNGVLVDSDAKREAALLLDHVIFSIDGTTQATVTRYQRGSDFEKAYGNMADLIRYRDARGARRPRVVWRYVLFRWNDRPEMIEDARSLGRSIGADALNVVPTFSPPYGVSLRFFVDPYFRRLGARTADGIMITLAASER